MIKNKKGVSVVIGYVILISVGIIMSLVVYNYLKTYVPKDAVQCPNGVSILITQYDCVGNSLNITLKNNGKFNYMGYYIHASENSSIDVATINLADNFINSSSGEAYAFTNSHILFSISDSNNFMQPQTETEHWFDLNGTSIKFIEITPTKEIVYKNKKRFVNCGNAKIKQEITCG
jgi:hypothetical protein